MATNPTRAGLLLLEGVASRWMGVAYHSYWLFAGAWPPSLPGGVAFPTNDSTTGAWLRSKGRGLAAWGRGRAS